LILKDRLLRIINYQVNNKLNLNKNLMKKIKKLIKIKKIKKSSTQSGETISVKNLKMHSITISIE
jgi:hypothetical protein